MHRSRASNQCDLEHPNVNDIRRHDKPSVNRSVAAKLRTSSMEFMAGVRTVARRASLG